MQTLVDISWLIPLLPLIGAVVAGLFGARHLRGQSHWPIWAGVGASAVLSLAILFSMIGADENRTVALHYPSVLKGEATESATGPANSAAAALAGMPTDGESHEPSADAKHAEGPDGTVKAYSVRWFTWIAAGNADEATRMEDGKAVRIRPGDALEDGRHAGGYFDISAGAFIDPLTAVMLAVVCGIGFLITVFAAGYMKGEQGYWRFFAYLGLFIFAMTILVMGDNLIMLYLGWEGVGLCSYLLVGYYYEKPAAREAAKKAFLVNRIGDFGFAIGIMLIFYCFGTVSYFGDGVGAAATGGAPGFVEMAANYRAYVPLERQYLVEWIPFALMLGAFGKSAQFPLYVWLPDAMEGPTPVSALIHAATMVTAGVYMIARLGSLFYQFNAALLTIAVVGAFTAIFAATIGMRQFDLKKVFAYSTISQLGYMFVGVAVLAPVAGVFHLVTHAFFKALLFLSSGVVMHAMLGHLDMRKMSGLKTQLPKTRWLMLVGCLALAGFPLTSGFFSKDEIIHFAGHNSGGNGDIGAWVLYLVLLTSAFITAYYTFRLYFRVFEGPTVVPETPALDHHGGGHDRDATHAHGHASASAVMAGDIGESGVDASAAHHANHDPHDAHHGAPHDHEPAIMILPLTVLAAGALLAGFLNVPFHWLGDFLGNSPSFAFGYDAARQEFSHLDGHHVTSVAAGFGYAHEIGWAGLFVGAAVAVAGIATAYYLHLVDRGKAVRLADALRPAASLLEGKYYVDEIYDAIIVRPLRSIGRAMYAIDRFVIDGLVWLLSFIPQFAGLTLRILTQRGNLHGYAVSMLFGVAVILLIVFL